VFVHACKLGLEGIVSKRRDKPYSSGRSPHRIKSKNPNAPAVRRESGRGLVRQEVDIKGANLGSIFPRRLVHERWRD
jgi:hypothetical protein